MKHSAKYLTAIMALVVFCSPSFAQVMELDWGGDLSVMGVYTNNTRNFGAKMGAANTAPRSVLGGRFDTPIWAGENDQDSFIRSEGHLWMRVLLAENVRAKVAVEFDRTFSSDDAYIDISGDSNKGRPASRDLDIYLEEAYIQASSLFDWPWTVTFGRQLIQWGSGFVIGDAIPHSPTNIADIGAHEQDPFDALNIQWELTEDLLVEILASKVAETRDVNEDTDLYGINLRYSIPKSAIIEGYYVFFNVSGDGAYGVPGISDPSMKVHQAGVRGELAITEELELNAEVTYQFAGKIKNSLPSGRNLDIGAFAAEAGIKYSPAALSSNDVAFGFSTAWLEGDKGDKDRRYRRYIQIADNRVYGEIADFYTGLISNDLVDQYYPGVYIFNLDAQASFEALLLAIEAYYFLAQHNITDRAGFNSGEKNIGWEVDLYGKYRLTENLDAEMAVGFFNPDDAAQDWAGGEDDTAWFARAGLKVTF